MVKFKKMNKIDALKDNKLLLAHAALFAQMHIKQGNALDPQVMSSTADNDMYLSIIPELGDRENGGREKALEEIKKFHKENNITRYAMVHEAWMLLAQPKRSVEDIYKKMKSIKNHPERIEIISACVVTKENIYGVVFQIKRDGKEVTFEEVALPEGASAADGDFMHLLP